MYDMLLTSFGTIKYKVECCESNYLFIYFASEMNTMLM